MGLELLQSRAQSEGGEVVPLPDPLRPPTNHHLGWGSVGLGALAAGIPLHPLPFRLCVPGQPAGGAPQSVWPSGPAGQGAQIRVCSVKGAAGSGAQVDVRRRPGWHLGSV